MTRILLLLIACMALLTAATAATPVATPDTTGLYMRLVEQADSLIAKEKYAPAIERLIEAMRTEPGNPGNVLLLSNRGMLHYYLGEDSLALACLDMARQMAPASVTVLMNRARVHNGLGNYSLAFADYDLATRQDSTLTEAWLQKGMIQLRGGDVRGAEASLFQAEKADPNSKELTLCQAILYSKTNRPSQALPYLNKILKKDRQPEYFAERAICRLRTDDLSGAAEDIVEGLSLDRDYADLYVARALLNRMRYREKDALNDAKKAVELGAPKDYVAALGFKL